MSGIASPDVWGIRRVRTCGNARDRCHGHDLVRLTSERKDSFSRDQLVLVRRYVGDHSCHRVRISENSEIRWPRGIESEGRSDTVGCDASLGTANSADSNLLPWVTRRSSVSNDGIRWGCKPRLRRPRNGGSPCNRHSIVSAWMKRICTASLDYRRRFSLKRLRASSVNFSISLGPFPYGNPVRGAVGAELKHCLVKAAMLSHFMLSIPGIFQ